MACGGVEAGRRLVEEDQLGIADERQRDVEAASLTTRQTLALRRGAVRQSDHFQGFPHLPGARVVPGIKRHALLHRQFRFGFRLLQHHPDTGPPLATSLGGVLSEHGHFATGAMAEALQNLHRRGLSRPVRPEERKHLASMYLKIYPADGLKRSIGHPQSTDLDDERRHSGLGSSFRKIPIRNSGE